MCRKFGDQTGASGHVNESLKRIIENCGKKTPVDNLQLKYCKKDINISVERRASGSYVFLPCKVHIDIDPRSSFEIGPNLTTARMIAKRAGGVSDIPI